MRQMNYVYKEFLSFLLFGERRINFTVKEFDLFLLKLPAAGRAQFEKEFFEEFYYIFGNESIKIMIDRIPNLSKNFLLRLVKTCNVDSDVIEKAISKIKIDPKFVIENYQVLEPFVYLMPSKIRKDASVQLLMEFNNTEEERTLSKAEDGRLTKLYNFSASNIIKYSRKFKWKTICREKDIVIPPEVEKQLSAELLSSEFLIYRTADENNVLPILRAIATSPTDELLSTMVLEYTLECLCFQKWGALKNRSSAFRAFLDSDDFKNCVSFAIGILEEKHEITKQTKKRLLELTKKKVNSNIIVRLPKSLQYGQEMFQGSRGISILLGVKV